MTDHNPASTAKSAYAGSEPVTNDATQAKPVTLASAQINAGLTKAQREVLARLDDRVWSLSELHPQTWAALFEKGLLADVRAAGHRFFTWTDVGLSVRQHLLQQDGEGRR